MIYPTLKISPVLFSYSRVVLCLFYFRFFTNSGAGVTVSVDKPLIKLEFWTNGLVLCPENTIQIFVEPGEEEVWTADYSLFASWKNV
jgi:hypothetical protein